MRLIITEQEKKKILTLYGIINEQGISTSQMENPPEEPEDNSNEYPNYCLYPNFAVWPENANLPSKGAEGEDLLIEGYCLYKSPMENSIEFETTGIWLPNTGETIINFANTGTGAYMAKYFYKEWKEKKRKDLINHDKMFKALSLDEVMDQCSKMFPNGSVYNFSIDGVPYVGRWIYDADSFRIKFRGYFAKDTEANTQTKYKNPAWVDRRNEFQTFIDLYGEKLVWFAVAAGLAISFAFTGPIAFWLEVGIELAITLPVAIRDIQKGENTSAIFNVLGIGLSLLRLSKTFKGIDENVLNSLITKLTKKEYLLLNDLNDIRAKRFFQSLSPKEKELFTKLIYDDELGLHEALKNLQNPKIFERAVIQDIKRHLAQNPDDLAKLRGPFWKRIGGKELKYAGAFMLVDGIYSELFGWVLDSEQKEKLKGLELIIPERLLPEYYQKMVDIPEEDIKKMCDNGQIQVVTDLISKSKNNEVAAQKLIDRLTEIKTKPNQDFTKTKNEVSDEKEIKKLLKKGYVKYENTEDGVTISHSVYIESTGDLYVLVDNSVPKKDVKKSESEKNDQNTELENGPQDNENQNNGDLKEEINKILNIIKK